MRVPVWRRLVPWVLALATVGGWAAWSFRPRPTLEGIDSLLAAGRYDAAEARWLAYLRAFPDDRNARLALARAAVSRPDPKLELALTQVGLVPAAGLDRERAAERKSIEGEARFLQRRYDAAEAAWLDALRIDPRVPEVGWGLLNLYALQGRDDDARALGLRLYAVEPDPHDRMQLLLQLVRHDAHPISPGSVAFQLEPVVRANPGDFKSSLALGRALVRESRYDRGLDLLRQATVTRGDDPEAWEAYLNGLADAGRVEELAKALETLPRALAGLPRFDAPRGWLAAQRQDWPAAAAAYRHAWEARPTDAPLAYRLQTALRNAERREESEALAPRLRGIAAAQETLRKLYDALDARPDLGRTPDPELCQQLGDALATIGRAEEARAWQLQAQIDRARLPARGRGMASRGGS